MAGGAHDGARPGGTLDPNDVAGKLYVASLPSDIGEVEIRKVFGIYGPIIDVHVNRPAEGRSDRSAFVRFEDEASASAAMLVLTDMYKFHETSPLAIVVSPARPRDSWKGGGGPNSGAGDTWASGPGRAGARPGGWQGGEAAIGNSAAPAPAAPAAQVSAAAGAGAPQHWGPGGAVPAPGVPPVPPPAYRSGGPPAMGGGRDPAGKLWVGNLPPEVNDEQMEVVFGTYGKVVEVNILPSKARSGQRCAFVVYGTREEADACLAAMATGYEMQPGIGELKVERPSDRAGGQKGYGSFMQKGGKGYYRPY